MPARHTPACRLSLAAVALLAMLASACDGSGRPASDEDAATPSGRVGDALDDSLRTRDRARAVEDLTLARKQELDDALQAQEGDGR
ncbi:MAG: hypothetical protein ACR2I8_11500 [Steroidobacteraceae bacterium]